MKELKSSSSSKLASWGETLYKEEVKNMLILLEHYKLQLSIVLPKIAGLIKRAKQKGNQQKLEKTKQASKCLIWNFNLF